MVKNFLNYLDFLFSAWYTIAMINKNQNSHTMLKGGVFYNVCPLCHNAVCYGDGVYKKGIEYHITCIQKKRQEKMKKGYIDFKMLIPLCIIAFTICLFIVF